MIPAIGLMIGGYIIFRRVEIICRPDSAFGSRGQMILVNVLGVIGILATGFLMFDLAMTSATTSTAISPLLH